jgi:hypothetical protein
MTWLGLGTHPGVHWSVNQAWRHRFDAYGRQSQREATGDDGGTYHAQASLVGASGLGAYFLQPCRFEGPVEDWSST